MLSLADDELVSVAKILATALVTAGFVVLICVVVYTGSAENPGITGLMGARAKELKDRGLPKRGGVY